MGKFEQLLDYIHEAIECFENDPADSQYQIGYQAALDDLLLKALDIKYKNRENSRG